MPGGRCGLFPGIEKLHQSEEYKQREEENALLRMVGRDRLLELAQAEKDGRLVVLPCRPGQIVWAKGSVSGCLTKFKAPDIEWIIESEKLFGKELFFTRAEAEAALKKRGEAGNEAD